MCMKPITELTIEEIRVLTQRDIDIYEDDTLSEIFALRSQISGAYEKYHNLAMILKRHKCDFKDYQQNAYQIKLRIDAMKKEIMERQTNFVLLKRNWQKTLGLNQVRTITKTTDGKMVLV
jgi:hypothetical protein